MSDVMLFGVLRMPMEMAMADDLSRMQFYQRAQQAADRIEELERHLAERDAQQAKQIGREPTDAMQAAGAQAIRFDTTLLNKLWTANAVFRAMWAAAAPAPSVSADARDAERYRWLRGQQWNESTLFVVAGHRSLVRLGTDCPSGERLDAAIDAAIAAQSSGASE
jgi:hypothetical protein